jgi:hypothetical protein
VLLLHNPDRTGYTSEAVWRRWPRCATPADRAIGVAPGPANGFTLDVIGCFERFGDTDRLGDADPQPARALARRAGARRGRAADVSVIARVVDYGGLFWDDVHAGHAFRADDHRAFRPAGWVEAGLERIERCARSPSATA